MMLLQLSASQGPAECQLAVAHALRRVLEEARAAGVDVEEVERVDGERPGTLRSVVLVLQGAHADRLAAAWQGTVQWICRSPWRPFHPRKNWFIGVHACAPLATAMAAPGDIRFEACRASGPGGQHVNKTDSAVRATHLASGISVKVQSERSQHANRRLAELLIAGKLAEREREALQDQRAERRQLHHQLERGHAVRIFKGERFVPEGGH